MGYWDVIVKIFNANEIVIFGIYGNNLKFKCEMIFHVQKMFYSFSAGRAIIEKLLIYLLEWYLLCGNSKTIQLQCINRCNFD